MIAVDATTSMAAMLNVADLLLLVIAGNGGDTASRRR
jgi:hypothetical protein